RGGCPSRKGGQAASARKRFRKHPSRNPAHVAFPQSGFEPVSPRRRRSDCEFQSLPGHGGFEEFLRGGFGPSRGRVFVKAWCQVFGVRCKEGNLYVPKRE